MNIDKNLNEQMVLGHYCIINIFQFRKRKHYTSKRWDTKFTVGCKGKAKCVFQVPPLCDTLS